MDFRFWEVTAFSFAEFLTWLCLLILFLWGVVKLTLYWLGSREDMLSVSQHGFSISVLEYLGGVIMAMLLGLLPITAVLSVKDLVDWTGRFYGFLIAYTLATGAATLSCVLYVPRRLHVLEVRAAETSGGCHWDAVNNHLKLTRRVWPFPAAVSAVVWTAWLLSLGRDEPLAGLCVAAIVIPGGSLLEELLLWRSRRKVRSARDSLRIAWRHARREVSSADPE